MSKEQTVFEISRFRHRRQTQLLFFQSSCSQPEKAADWNVNAESLAGNFGDHSFCNWCSYGRNYKLFWNFWFVRIRTQRRKTMIFCWKLLLKWKIVDWDLDETMKVIDSGVSEKSDPHYPQKSKYFNFLTKKYHRDSFSSRNYFKICLAFFGSWASR